VLHRRLRRSMNGRLSELRARDYYVRFDCSPCSRAVSALLRPRRCPVQSHFLKREITHRFRLMSERSAMACSRFARATREAREPLTQPARQRGENRKCSVKVRRCLLSSASARVWPAVFRDRLLAPSRMQLAGRREARLKVRVPGDREFREIAGTASKVQPFLISSRR